MCLFGDVVDNWEQLWNGTGRNFDGEGLSRGYATLEVDFMRL